MVRVIGGVCAAALMAALASGASVFGIALWKIALALAGCALFVMAGRKESEGARGREPDDLRAKPRPFESDSRRAK